LDGDPRERNEHMLGTEKGTKNYQRVGLSVAYAPRPSPPRHRSLACVSIRNGLAARHKTVVTTPQQAATVMFLGNVTSEKLARADID
jgi:hypothetical protein